MRAFQLNRESGTTLVLVTHDEQLRSAAAHGAVGGRDRRVIRQALRCWAGLAAENCACWRQRWWWRWQAHQRVPLRRPRQPRPGARRASVAGRGLVLVSDHAWKRDVADEIARRGLQRAEAVNFISMARVGEASVLAGVKAVTENYPLRGRLRTASAPNAPDAPAARGPERGSVWLEERLVSALGAPVGASLKLGSAELKVAAVLTLEPERGTNFFNIAPRLMMHAAVCQPRAGADGQPRVFYLYAAGEPAALAAFEAWAREHLARGQRVENRKAGAPRCAPRSSARSAFSASPRCSRRSRGRRHRARHAPFRRAPPGRLRGDALLRRTQGRLLSLYGTEFLLLGTGACALAARWAMSRRARSPRRWANCCRVSACAGAAARAARLPSRPGAAARLRAAAAGA